MILSQSAMYLLVDDTSHVTARAVVRHHVKVLKRLKGVVQLRDKSMVDFTLNLFLCDNEARQPVVSTFLHAFHGVEYACTITIRLQSLYQIDFRIRTCSKQSNTFEVLGHYIEITICQGSGILPGPRTEPPRTLLLLQLWLQSEVFNTVKHVSSTAKEIN
mgnify:CR=1 FL=1